ncbi:MAG: hypothetical protein N2379_02005 [Verrucomicrobiae bacterium]|nr:hypothetical protein [Verrucomicrobiae bacterium]
MHFESAQLSGAVTPAQVAEFVRQRLPPRGLFAGLSWRIAPAPFVLGPELADALERLGRVLLRFYQAANLLYRHSVEGAQPGWVAELLDRGKPAELIALQRSAVFRNALPRVIRPDVLLSDNGLCITELDSVPGGIGLTAWLNQTYAAVCGSNWQSRIIGGAKDMLDGFAAIFGDAPNVHIVVSDEAATYRPEMEWLAAQLGARFGVRDGSYTGFGDGDAVYRFFELFDLANVPAAKTIFDLAAAGRIVVTPPPKPALEEKLLFALFWNRNLREFWIRALGAGFFHKLQQLFPYTWVIDPMPMPPHAVIPRLEITSWDQLKLMSQTERQLVLKVSGFSPLAWGARGVYLGSDMSREEWAAVVDTAIQSYSRAPYVLQEFHKPRRVKTEWFDFARGALVEMDGRVRLCPYYFVIGDNSAARARLGGVLATICPADKKIIHGMNDAVLAPCAR